MGIRNKLLTCAAATAGSLGLALSGSAVLAPAHAAAQVLTPTDYGFKGHAFGTHLLSKGAGLESGRTAFSYIGCTRIAGLKDHETAASVTLPTSSDPYVTVDSVVSNTQTFKRASQHIAAGFQSTNSIGHVQLGSSSTPQLVFNGLKTVSRAWATTGGKLKAKNTLTSGQLDLLNIPNNAPQQVLDLKNALEQGINQVITTLNQNAGTIEIPGLGAISTGMKTTHEGTSYASARAMILQVLLYGPDGQKDSVSGGNDDSHIIIGNSWARVQKNLPAGVMRGSGYGAKADVLNGALTIGRLGRQPLPCAGTHGKVLTNAAAKLAPPGAPFSLGASQGRTYGIQNQTGSARAWTEGSLGSVKIGPLVLKGIVGRVNLQQDRWGNITQNNFKGSTIGEVIVNGKKQGGIDPGQTSQIPTSQLPPGVAKIELFKRHRDSRSASITAVTVTFGDTSAGYTVLRLGSARAALHRY